MEPVLQRNQVVVVNSLGKPKLSSVVVAVMDGREVVKRIVKEKNHSFWLEGDNKDASTDSRIHGWVEAADILGVVVMPRKTSKYWFKRKRYGWGWVPITWQGWLLFAVLIVGALLPAIYFDTDGGNISWGFLVFLGVYIASFVYLVSRKSPKPKWRWGKTENDNPEEDF